MFPAMCQKFAWRKAEVIGDQGVRSYLQMCPRLRSFWASWGSEDWRMSWRTKTARLTPMRMGTMRVLRASGRFVPRGMSIGDGTPLGGVYLVRLMGVWPIVGFSVDSGDVEIGIGLWVREC